jgi:hypothetical protein
MRTDLQNETSRRNGSKSRGPKTDTGKAVSSRNRYSHGMLSKNIVIEGEDGTRFSALLNSLRADLHPTNFIEENLVEDLAFCKWRQRRLLAMETACLTNEIRRQNPTAAAEAPAIRVVIALNSLSTDVNTLELINRYELRFDRQYNRTLRRLVMLRELEKSTSCHSNPGTS